MKDGTEGRGETENIFHSLSVLHQFCAVDHHNAKLCLYLTIDSGSNSTQKICQMKSVRHAFLSVLILRAIAMHVLAVSLSDIAIQVNVPYTNEIMSFTWCV